MKLTERFDGALVFARQRHEGQTRKGTDIPYISHLMSTAALVLEAGGDEDQAIAGLLHDSLEDSAHTKVTYHELVERFGERVARIVRDCSDQEPTPDEDKEAWRPRKERYIGQIGRAPLESQLVANADKLHNARSILADYRRLGEGLWTRFNPESNQLWYYRTLADLFLAAGTALAMELDRVVSDMEEELAT
ncbi:MAG TPA: HD domain-containing protein [Acidimicrobiia bacterium]|jgi:(p)ppGpp synthase/HD superfamily hydrolase